MDTVYLHLRLLPRLRLTRSVQNQLPRERRRFLLTVRIKKKTFPSQRREKLQREQVIFLRLEKLLWPRKRRP